MGSVERIFLGGLVVFFVTPPIMFIGFLLHNLFGLPDITFWQAMVISLIVFIIERKIQKRKAKNQIKFGSKEWFDSIEPIEY